ncbi:helix-turn-helix domain-containing protein [Chitinophaga sp. RAB17]|uniref:helix-turn-helix domain-containing protein n=1 Tax=Chitinophaga sp. RAB17 TaxID=3233049 RepID=UPI003F8F8F87
MLLRSIILSGAIQGCFLILLLNAKRRNSTTDWLLMGWLGITALQLLFYYDNLSVYPVAPEYLQLLGFSLPLLSAPVLYLYIYSLAFGPAFKWRRTWAHILSYVLFNVVIAGLVSTHPDNVHAANGFLHFGISVPGWLAGALNILLAIVPGTYAILSLRVLLLYQRSLPDSYSYTEEVNLNWLKWVVISLLIEFVVLFLLIRFGVDTGLLTYSYLFAVVGSVLAAYIFFIGYFGLRQTVIFTNIPEAAVTSAAPSYKNSGLNETMAAGLFDKLKQHMDEHKPYLEEDLSLATLADQLEMTTNQLSQVINQRAAVNFFTFINSYRVAAVKARLKDPAYAHYAIIDIGYDCGFRSKSSFNKIFKEMVGITPSQYQKS